MPYVFIRNYQDYLDKKTADSSFCKKTTCNKSATTQGKYLMHKIYKTPCKETIEHITTINSSCEILAQQYSS